MTRFIRFFSTLGWSMCIWVSSSDWFRSDSIRNNSDLAWITLLRGSSTRAGDKTACWLPMLSRLSVRFLFPLNLSDRWSLLRTSLNFIPTLKSWDNHRRLQNESCTWDISPDDNQCNIFRLICRRCTFPSSCTHYLSSSLRPASETCFMKRSTFYLMVFYRPKPIRCFVAKQWRRRNLKNALHL